jgi:FlaA1/EpsC-like NDP-sugar epimerase
MDHRSTDHALAAGCVTRREDIHGGLMPANHRAVPGHGLLAGKTVVVTAAAGTGIGGAVARRCLLEEGASIVISDATSVASGRPPTRAGGGVRHPPRRQVRCDVTDEDDVQALLGRSRRATSGTST